MDPSQSIVQGGVDPMLGRTLDGSYYIEQQLGEGGIGRVYVALHQRLGRRFALKTLLTRYESIPVLKERFTREARALAQLSHPNIVGVIDFGVDESTPYIAMELLQGEDLAAMCAREPIEPTRALGICRQMIRALSYAHARELVHRDLKPHNVFVRALGPRDDHVWVLDFGLARFLSDAWKNAPKLTAQGALIGTPAYMAPEQASGQDVNAAADVYAAGCVMFEAFTGRRVFEAKSQGDIIRMHMLETPPSLHRADSGLEVSPELDAFMARALAKSPAQRFRDGAEMLDAFDALPAEPLRRVGARPAPSPLVSAPPVAPTQTSTRAPAPQAPRYTDPGPARLPTSRAPLLFGAAFAALLLMGIGAGGVYFFMRGMGGDDAGEPIAEEGGPPPPEPVLESPPDHTLPPREPFDSSSLPDPIRDVYEQLEAGRGQWRQHTSTISHYQNDHPDDPRAALLLGRIYSDEHLWGPALNEYGMAYSIDPTVRGDPHMREDVIRIARVQAEHASASALIQQAYGAEAAQMITDYIAAQRHIPAQEQVLLESLRARIEPQP